MLEMVPEKRVSIGRPVEGRIETAVHGAVYVALRTDGLVKVGISSDPGRRRRELETASGHPVERFQSFTVYAPGACERHLHHRWGWARLNGEWFLGGAELFAYLVAYLECRQSRC